MKTARYNELMTVSSFIELQQRVCVSIIILTRRILQQFAAVHHFMSAVNCPHVVVTNRSQPIA